MSSVDERWRAHAQHIVAAIQKIRRIVARGDISEDEVLHDAVLRNLQTLFRIDSAPSSGIEGDAPGNTVA